MGEEEILRRALTDYFVAACLRLGGDDDELADKLKVSESLIYQIKRGDRNVTIDHLAMLARALNESPFTVLAGVIAVGLNPPPPRQVGRRVVTAPGSRGESVVDEDLAKEMRGPVNGSSKPPGK